MKTNLEWLFLFCVALVSTGCERLASLPSWTKPVAFDAYRPGEDFCLPPIVLQYDPAAKTGANWAEVNHPQWHEATPSVILGRAANYLREGLQRMTGKDYPVVSTNDLSKGIVLVLLKNAPEDIRNDRSVRRALRADPKFPYSASEAFYLRSEKNRLLVVANTPDGLADGVVELLESVDYEILGMGPDWIYAPDYRNRPLVFALKRAARPSFYRRLLWAHSGQVYGCGTILSGLTDPLDESVDVSSWRWNLGTRMAGKSMPDFPGHALQVYHRKIIDKMRELGCGEGFFFATGVGPVAQRPPADPESKDHWWVATDPKGSEAFGKIFVCDGKEWKPYGDGNYFGQSVDLSVPFVRQIIFEDMKKQTEAAFQADPDNPVVFAMDPEDGEADDTIRIKLTAHKNWYPEYLAQEKLPFGRPYALNGYKGINQPKEVWDPESASDCIFGFANYLLHEYDKWIDSLPKEQRLTSTGKSKKELVRCSLQSYNYHDVPPNFNPDSRTRASIAPFPKHRGIGKWEKLASQEDVARALHVMLPNEPSGDYSFFSFSFHNDGGPGGIPTPAWCGSAASIAQTCGRYYDAGFRSIVREIDFNFGKSGLGYYLVAKVLWDVNLGEKGLEAIRDRWFQRSFGSAWKEMKAYYDFMLPENYPVNSPNIWAKAIRLIDAADKKIDGAKEPEAQRRIDDVKQYWYSHYLMDSGLFTTNAPEVKEFLWKGQMSYMVGMHGLLGRDFKSSDVKAVVGPQISAGPAHYTHTEVQSWWPKILDRWTVTPVNLFNAAALANGKPAKKVDLNDLVMVKEFQTEASDAPFFYNSGYMTPVPFLMVARQKDDPLGFKLSWPFNPNDNYYTAKKVPYGAEIWDPAAKTWEPWIDKTTTFQPSAEHTNPQGTKLQVVDVQLRAPRPGIYRFSIGYGGNLSSLASPAYNPVSGKYSRALPFTYYTNASGLTQSPVYLYIPKKTRSLDFEVLWDFCPNFLTLYKGLPDKKPSVSRRVDIGKMGAHTVALEPGEDGTVAMFEGNNFYFPYLYSIPSFWAKVPSALLVPRAIAEADGLTVLNQGKAR